MTVHPNNFEAEMLELLLKNLASDFDAIKKFKEDGNLDQLQKQVHKLHGALCYCGVPFAKNATADLEKALLNGETNKIPSLFELFECEILKLMQNTNTKK